ncbi:MULTISPECIES: hypothetical protein [Streptomyces]|nr:hypothetical protein [Streptomyces nanshensis]
MSSELRRQLREALGPDIKGLQRAVALEIADDARYDDGWMQLAGRSGPHRPYQDSWRRLEEEGRNGSRPQGWERVPHCGDSDCDEVTRRRDTTGHDGLPTTTLCQRCHPAMRF